MKKNVLIASVFMMAVTSCSKEELVESASLRVAEICGEESSTDLVAGQHLLMGDVTVSNDADFLYVTYNSTGNWVIRKTHLYVGPCDAIPTNGGGNPRIGHFPFTSTHPNTGVTSYTFTVPAEVLGGCGCVAAHAEVVRFNSRGSVIQSETAWGSGPEIGGNSWAMKFNYCLEECDSEEEQPS